MGRGLSIICEHHQQSCHFLANNPTFHGSLPRSLHYCQVKAHVSTCHVVGVLGLYLLEGAIIQFCQCCSENLSLLCAFSSADTLKNLSLSSLVITQVHYQSMLQSQLYFSEQTHPDVFPVILQQKSAGLTILIKQLLYSHEMPQQKAVLKSFTNKTVYHNELHDGIKLPKDNYKYCFLATDWLAMRICHQAKETSIFYYLKQQCGLTRVITMIRLYLLIGLCREICTDSLESGLCQARSVVMQQGLEC